MAEPVDWRDGDTPYSARYGDIYRSSAGGLAQAQQVFLGHCGLPLAWSGQPRWCILETGFGLGLNFLAAWQAWRADPTRPKVLHFVSVEAHPVSTDDLRRSAQPFAELRPLADALASQWWGLTRGWHRLSFDGGQVLLTLGIGDVQERLAEQSFLADSVFLDGFDPQCNPRMWSDETLHAVARLCRPGAPLATWTTAGAVRDALTRAGFEVERLPGLPPKRHSLRAIRRPDQAEATPGAPVHARAGSPGHAVVVGSGIAGASVAASLARRGWTVQVIDEASVPAAGASGLPAGLFAPHVSPDDAPLSRLTRAGVRATRQCLEQHLPDGRGSDWDACGVLERPIERVRQLPSPETAADPIDSIDPGGDAAHHAALRDFSRPATADDCAALADPYIPPAEPGALWHAAGGWLRPAALVQALLATPGVHWQGNARVSRITERSDESGWRVWDAGNQPLAEADLVVVAAATASRLWCPDLPLQALRGQVTCGTVPAGAAAPRVPVNGHGSVIAGVTCPGLGDGPLWIVGSTFERGRTDTGVDAAAHPANLQRLQRLAPAFATQVAHIRVAGWAGVRATLPDRLPAVGPLRNDADSAWVMTGFGSRGLTLAPLAAELLCAWLHGEPSPVDRALGLRLQARRFKR